MKFLSISFVAILILALAASSLSQATCPTCRCRHYVWMGVLLIAFGVIIVLLTGLIGVILFKVCVLSRENKENDEVDSKVANRIPYELSINLALEAAKKEKKKWGFRKKGKTQETSALKEEENFGVAVLPDENEEKIVGLNFSRQRMILFKAYRFLWNESITHFGVHPSNELIDRFETLLHLGESEIDPDDEPIIRATKFRFEKDHRKLMPVFNKIKELNESGSFEKEKARICNNLFNTLFRLAHNRGEDILQERILSKEGENPFRTVTPYFTLVLYPAIFKTSSSEEIQYFLQVLFNSSAEACRNGESILSLSSHSSDSNLQDRLKNAFPDLEKLAEEIELRERVEQPEMDIEEPEEVKVESEENHYQPVEPEQTPNEEIVQAVSYGDEESPNPMNEAYERGVYQSNDASNDTDTGELIVSDVQVEA